MKAYDEKHIKNIALVGAPKSGKTTLAETMAFEASLISRRGTVEQHNTISDYHEIEKERGNSVYATLLHTEWRDYKINIVDTPGMDEFIGEVITSVRVADNAVVVLNAQYGVEVSTRLIWEYVSAFQKPALVAINQLDAALAEFDQTLEEAREFFGPALTLMQYPLDPGLGFHQIIDLLKMTLYVFPPEGGKPQKLPIPETEMERAHRLHTELVEKAAENDDSLMELYFEKGTLNEDEMRLGLKIGMRNRELVPVFCLSARYNMGSGRMMGFVDNVAPSALETQAEKTLEDRVIRCAAEEPVRILVFKTLLEPHLGHLSFFKVVAGTLTAGMELTGGASRAPQRITQLFIADGQRRVSVPRLKAGDIGCTLKLKNTHTGDTLNGPGAEGFLAPFVFPAPKVRIAICCDNKADEDRLSGVLQEIHTEDPTLEIEYNQELAQIIVHGQGELHLQVTRWRLEHTYKLHVSYSAAGIPYRETIRRPATAGYRHKKQSGGAGQFAEVYLKIEPYEQDMAPVTGYNVRDTQTEILPWGGTLVFNNCIVGGAIDARFLPAILKGIMEELREGPLTGSYVRDIRVSVYDGKMHPVDSNEISFKIAGMMAFRDAFHRADPLLLEPVYEIRVSTPVQLVGDIMSEVQSHRSLILGIETQGPRQLIRASTPQAELDLLIAAVRNVSQGKARIDMRFASYAPVPDELQKKLVDAYTRHPDLNN